MAMKLKKMFFCASFLVVGLIALWWISKYAKTMVSYLKHIEKC